MAVCRNCGNLVPTSSGHCLQCGAEYGGQNGPTAKTPQWGGLDLDIAHERADQKQRVRKAEERPADASRSATGTSKREQRSMGASEEIGLSNARGAAFDDPLGGNEDDDVVLQLDVDAAKRGIKEKSEREKAQQKAVDAAENENRKIEAIAKYGRSPANNFAAVGYAARVLWRRYRLRSDLLDLAEKTKQAREYLHKSLCAVGAVMFARRDSREMQPYRDQIQSITNAELRIRELRESHQQVRASSVGLMQDVMQTIKEVQLRAEPLRAEESKFLEELSQVEKVRQKHEGIIAQAEAEHKTLLQNAGSKPDPSFIAAFDRERRKRQEKLDLVIEKINGINSKIDGIRARLQEIKQEIDALHHQRKSLHTDRARSEQQHKKESDGAQNAYERAQAMLGECGLIDDIKDIAQREIAKARSAKESLRKVEQQAALYEKAKSAYDRPALMRGLYMVGALTGLVIVALIAVTHLVPDSDAVDLDVDKVTQE